MLKRNSVKRVGRSPSARTALFRSLAKELLERGAIQTSETRAKAIRGFVDRVVRSAGKKEGVSQKRVVSLLGGIDRNSALKIALYNLEAGKSATRIVRLGTRVGDRSSRVRLELLAKKPEVQKPVESAKKPKKKTAIKTK